MPLPSECLEVIVPDTERPIATVCIGAGPETLWQRQRLRRADILCKTRILIGREGYETFSVRRLADCCSLSPQTIYNLVGDRKQLLCGAIGQHLDALIQTASGLQDYPAFFMAFTDVVWCHAMKNRSYATTVTRSHFLSRSEPADNSRSIMHRAVCQQLLDLRQRGGLREATDVELLAQQMQSTITITALNWAEGCCGDAELRRRLAVGIGLLLLGAMTRQGRETTERWVDKMQRLH